MTARATQLVSLLFCLAPYAIYCPSYPNIPSIKQSQSVSLLLRSPRGLIHGHQSQGHPMASDLPVSHGSSVSNTTPLASSPIFACIRLLMQAFVHGSTRTSTSHPSFPVFSQRSPVWWPRRLLSWLSSLCILRFILVVWDTVSLAYILWV